MPGQQPPPRPIPPFPGGGGVGRVGHFDFRFFPLSLPPRAVAVMSCSQRQACLNSLCIPSFHSSVGQSVRLLTSRLGVQASLGARSTPCSCCPCGLGLYFAAEFCVFCLLGVCSGSPHPPPPPRQTHHHHPAAPPPPPPPRQHQTNRIIFLCLQILRLLYNRGPVA